MRSTQTQTQTDYPSAFAIQVAAMVDTIEEPQQQRNISACVEVLASLRFEPDLIRQYLREELMRESPIYQEIIREGVQRGKQDNSNPSTHAPDWNCPPPVASAGSNPVYRAIGSIERGTVRLC